MDELKKAYKIAKIIGVAMIISVFIYGGVTEVIKAVMTKNTGAPFEGFVPGAPFLVKLKFILFLLAIAQFVLIRFIRKAPLKVKETDASGKPDISALAGKLISSALITYAFADSIVIYGLVIFLIGGSSADFFPFFILSLGTFLIYFPRISQWEQVAKEHGYKLGQAM